MDRKVSPMKAANTSTTGPVLGARTKASTATARAAQAATSSDFMRQRPTPQPIARLATMLNSPNTANAQAPYCNGKPQDATMLGKWVPRYATWKPQTKKPAAGSRNERSASAVRTASPVLVFFCPAGAACVAWPFSIKAAGRHSSTSKPISCIAVTQPRPRISAPVTGAMTNWPNEPPALTMPVARPRHSGAISRVVAAISTAGPAMPAPPADSMPMAKISPAVLVISGVSTVPSATSEAPTSSTRPAPTLSAMAPANGYVRPQNSWPKANARLMLHSPSPRPVAVLSGPRN